MIDNIRSESSSKMDPSDNAFLDSKISLSYIFFIVAHGLSIYFAFVGSATFYGQGLLYFIFLRSLNDVIVLYILGLPLVITLVFNVLCFRLICHISSTNPLRLIVSIIVGIGVAFLLILLILFQNMLLWTSMYNIFLYLGIFAGFVYVTIFAYMILLNMLFAKNPNSYLRESIQNTKLWLGYFVVFIIILATLYPLFEAQTIDGIHEPTFEDILRRSNVEAFFTMPMAFVLPALPLVFAYYSYQKEQ